MNIPNTWLTDEAVNRKLKEVEDIIVDKAKEKKAVVFPE